MIVEAQPSCAAHREVPLASARRTRIFGFISPPFGLVAHAEPKDVEPGSHRRRLREGDRAAASLAPRLGMPLGLAVGRAALAGNAPLRPR